MFNLKKFRKDHKLTQTDLAFIFECGQPNIVSMEKDMRDLTPKQKAILTEKYGDISSYYSDAVDSHEDYSNKWERLAYQQQTEIERLISLLEEEKKENARLIETVDNLLHLLSDKKAAV